VHRPMYPLQPVSLLKIDICAAELVFYVTSVSKLQSNQAFSCHVML